jgi:ABC-2 type transport system ATP-binding protein
MEQTPVLKISNLTKKIGNRTIVDHLSFDVYPGEVFGLLGPNGAGKTTIISMIVGLMAMSEGDIFINGFSIKTHFEEAIKHVGAIVENPELYKFLSGYQNLVHFARMVPGVTEERIKEVIALVKLENRIDDLVKTYSLGMRQRLGLAQALLHRPNLLILDEPTNGLDPAGIRELRDYLRHLAKEEGTAVVVSSHLLSEMELMCDRVAIVQQGKLIDMKRVNERVSGDKENLRVQFEVDQTEKISGILKKLKWEKKMKLSKNGFEIEMSREQIAELNASLVAEGIKVYGIRVIEKTLEDRFLEVTEGDQIA